MSPDVGSIIFILQMRKLRLSDLAHLIHREQMEEDLCRVGSCPPVFPSYTRDTPLRPDTLGVLAGQLSGPSLAFYTSRLFPLPRMSFPSSLPGILPLPFNIQLKTPLQ